MTPGGSGSPPAILGPIISAGWVTGWVVDGQWNGADIGLFAADQRAAAKLLLPKASLTVWMLRNAEVSPVGEFRVVTTDEHVLRLKPVG